MAITKTPFSIENLVAQSLGGAVSEKLGNGISNGLNKVAHLEHLERGSDFIMQAVR